MHSYSFIIPHKNNPDLLNRCVNSIPQREDVQIIVVDDNSDSNKKPDLNRKDVTLIFLNKDNSNGAGRARNVGLASADGAWVIFADADDYYVDGFINILDEHFDDNAEVVYFNACSVFSDTLAPASRTSKMQQCFEKYDGSKESENDLKFGFHSPWNKMVRLDFIKKWNISFEEIFKGNDTLYSYSVGFLASNVKIDKRIVYIYTYAPNSLTTGKKNSSQWLCDLKNYFKQKKFLNYVECGHLGLSLPRFVARQIKSNGFQSLFVGLVVFLAYFNSIRSDSHKYVNIIEEKIKICV